MKLSFSFLLLALAVNKAQASGGPCACEVEELGGWKIDCEDKDAMLAALEFLQTNSCVTDCSSEDCERNYYVVQAHHDYCPEAGIPEAIEDGFHDYDTACTACGIKRKIVDNAPDCPIPNCEDDSGNQAYTDLVVNGCNLDCTTQQCKGLFGLLRITHDSCDHDVLSTAAEKGFHDLEKACADAVCNDPEGFGKDPLVCDEDDHDHDHDHSHDDAAFAASATGAALMGTAAAVLLV